jgi:serine protease Do
MSIPRSQWIIAALLALVGLLAGLLIATHFELPPDTPASSMLRTTETEIATPNPNFEFPQPAEFDPGAAPSNPIGNKATLPDIGVVSLAFSQIAEKVIPVVVSIASTKIIPAADWERSQDRADGGNSNDGRGFRFYPPRAYRQQGSGSGIILTQDGYILTNVHVIQHAAKIVVTLHDNRSFPGKIAGLDPLTEVAVVKVDAQGLPIAQLGDSDKIDVGQWVLAIGNPMNLRSTVTAGIVSAKGRTINIITDGFGVENFIQTDAAINPGNSGGALVNLAGQVIGVNTAIATETGYAMGLGFAIPIKLASKIAVDLIRYGKVARGYLGIALQEISELHARALKLGSPSGVLVDDVYEGSPAQAGGLLPMDVILSIDGVAVKRINQVQALIAGKNPGVTIKLRLVRNQREMEKRITLGELQPNFVTNRNGKRSPNQLDYSRFKNLGMEIESLTVADAAALGYKGEGGVMVTRVEKLSPAEESGIRTDDVIIAVDRSPVRSKENFLARLQQMKSGDVIIFALSRRGGRYHVFIEVP